MGERVRASEYPCGDARWDCSEWRGRVGLALLLETAAHRERAVDARRYMEGDSLWQPTGERVRVRPDGTVERIDTDSVDGEASVRRVGKKAAGRLLDGREHNDGPLDAAGGGR